MTAEEFDWKAAIARRRMYEEACISRELILAEQSGYLPEDAFDDETISQTVERIWPQVEAGVAYLRDK